LATSLAAQQGPAPTSGVSGAIVDESGQPVSTVMIVVFPVDEQKWTTGRDSKTVQWTAADAGAFKITGLPPGEYKLAITQEKIDGGGPDAALLGTLVRRGFPLSLAAGQQAQLQIVLNAQMQLSRVGMSGLQRVIAGPGSSGTLPPGPGPGARIGAPPNLPPAPTGPAAISGKVTDADGKPVVGAQIQRLLPVVRNGVTQFAPTGQPTMTDEEGVYHLKGLMPGNFLVAAVARSLDFSAPGAPELTHMPASIVGPDGRKLGYVTTYYPGTDTTARAARVTVGVSEVAGINFSLQRQPMADVSGTLTGAALTPLDDAAVLLPAAQADGTLGTESRRAAVTRDGHFLFPDVPFGPYVLNFTSSGGWAHETITVSATMEPLKIALKTPLRVNGRVDFLGDTPPPTGETLKSFRVRLAPAVLVSGARSFEVAIQPSGEFTFLGVPAGRYMLQSRATPPWTEMAGKLGDEDTLDTPVEVTESRDDAVVVLVDREAGISGTVKEVSDTPHDALVVVYSADRQYWTSGTRRIRVSRIVGGGGFSVAGLPPGQYLAFALPLSADTPAVNNALLETYQGRAQRFELAAREHRTIEIQMIR
jgi:protocatechuate 3,4-dioxygenase beta subunit